MKYNYKMPDSRCDSPLCDKILDGSHVLIGGQKGSGKSVFINNVLKYILYNENPLTTRLVLIDPQRIELSFYKDLPFTDDFAFEVPDILKTLDNVIETLNNRIEEMSKTSKVMYDGPRIYVIIDEMAYLMSNYQNVFLPRILRIVRFGSACKITLICTVRTSDVQIIPAQLMNCFNIRVALRCNDFFESNQIVKCSGAEKLLRNGSCLVYNGADDVCKYKVEYVTHESISDIREHWLKYPLKKKKEKKHNPVNFDVDGAIVAFKHIIKFSLIAIVAWFLIWASLN